MRRVWWLLAVVLTAVGCSPEQTEAWLDWWRDEPRAAVRWVRHGCDALCTDDWDRDGIVEPEAETESIEAEENGDEGSDSAGVYWPWDALAECESGGDWSIDTGNGYVGGLQWLPSTWNAYRDSDDPSYAADASREQQIAAAERLLAAEGDYGAWPTCAARLGLPT